MAFEHDGLGGGIGRFQIPQPRGAVLTSGDHPAVVRAEGHGANPTLMAFEHDGLGGGIGRFQIPQPRGPVLTSGDHPAVVRAEGHARDT